jgi:hypothetical protein
LRTFASQISILPGNKSFSCSRRTSGSADELSLSSAFSGGLAKTLPESDQSLKKLGYKRLVGKNGKA